MSEQTDTPRTDERKASFALDTIRQLETELTAVTEQRDRLAEALEYVVDDLDFEICERIGHSDKWCSLITAREALQSLTTNAKTIYGEKGSTP